MDLGNNQQTRFQCLGELTDLEKAISNLEKAVALADDRHPAKPLYLSNLGNSQEAHFKHLGKLSDLERVISNQQRAVKLTDDEHSDKPLIRPAMLYGQKTTTTTL